MNRSVRSAAFVSLAMLVGVACDRGSAAAGKNGGQNGEALAATPARQAPPYTVRPLDVRGALVGTIEIDGAPPADSVIQPPFDQQVCGAAFRRPGVTRRGNRAGGVIVWIEGIRSGKPLPLDRRFEISNERCMLQPELQAVVAGGTLNVRSQDAIEHRTVIKRDGEILTTIRETDEGQVVPNEQVLAKSGVLELSCSVHAWTRAWIAVFDHPYFSTSTPDGSFAVDSIPPGRYAVKMFHPRLGAVQDSVTIDAGVTSSVTLRTRAVAQ